MKYYIIAGEASGDLHASHFIRALIEEDPAATFRFFGGDLMAEAAGERGRMIRHYKQLAFMGFIPVLMHLPTILEGMRMCKRDIVEWQPDVVLLVDYPGFNLSIARFVKAKTSIPTYYYIAPKIWAWKEYRIKNIRRDVDEMFSILPFEVEFFEQKHSYPIHYIGNPTACEVAEFKRNHPFGGADSLGCSKPIIALLAGSRLQEIADNLPPMIEAASTFSNEYDLVVAGAPSVPKEFYDRFIEEKDVSIVYGKTYHLLHAATAALVTSGTATLETALFRVPQVVCYRMRMARLMGFLRRLVLKVKYISLVNLIADREVVPELVADTFSVSAIREHLSRILPSGSARASMLEGYEDVARRLGNERAPQAAARLITALLGQRH